MRRRSAFSRASQSPGAKPVARLTHSHHTRAHGRTQAGRQAGRHAHACTYPCTERAAGARSIRPALSQGGLMRTTSERRADRSAPLHAPQQRRRCVGSGIAVVQRARLTLAQRRKKLSRRLDRGSLQQAWPNTEAESMESSQWACSGLTLGCHCPAASPFDLRI